jgi:hypothetical protein
MRHNLYVKVLAKMDARIKNAFGETKIRLAPKTLIDLAKQVGYIEGVRGYGGGYNITDKGIEYLGYDLNEFTSKEQSQKMQDMDDLKRRQREASQQRANELAKMVAEAQKEFVSEAPKSSGVTIRKGSRHAATSE